MSHFLMLAIVSPNSPGGSWGAEHGITMNSQTTPSIASETATWTRDVASGPDGGYELAACLASSTLGDLRW